MHGAWNRVYLPGSNAQCVYCTEKAIAFLGSPYPQLPFGINIALVQKRYHCFRQLRNFPNFHSRHYTRWMKPVYLPVSNAQCVYCTEKAIEFWGSPYPQLHFDINIAWVQRLLGCKGGTIVFDCCEVSQISILDPIHGAWNWVHLPGRNAQCVYSTTKAIAFLGSPYPQLPFDNNIAWVQRRYHCFPQLRIFSNFHSRPYTPCMKPGAFAGK